MARLPGDDGLKRYGFDATCTMTMAIDVRSVSRSARDSRKRTGLVALDRQPNDVD